MLHPLPCYRVSKMEWPKNGPNKVKWPINGPNEMKWPKLAKDEMKWSKMVQDKGEKSIGICKGKYIKVKCLNWDKSYF